MSHGLGNLEVRHVGSFWAGRRQDSREGSWVIYFFNTRWQCFLIKSSWLRYRTGETALAILFSQKKKALSWYLRKDLGPTQGLQRRPRAGCEEIPKSPGAHYKRRSRALRKWLAQDPNTGMAELELSGELAKLLEQEVCLKCLSAAQARCLRGSPGSAVRNSHVYFRTFSKTAGSVRDKGGRQWGSEVWVVKVFISGFKNTLFQLVFGTHLFRNITSEKKVRIQAQQ